MDKWTEIEDLLLTNQPMIHIGKGRGSKCVPDPDHPPTEAYLFGFECERKRRGVARKRCMFTLTGETEQELTGKIEFLVMRNDVLLIPQAEYGYQNSRREPTPLAKAYL
jgi:hypothetical protein